MAPVTARSLLLALAAAFLVGAAIELTWALRDDDEFSADFREWLSTTRGRFETFYAERNRARDDAADA